MKQFINPSALMPVLQFLFDNKDSINIRMDLNSSCVLGHFYNNKDEHIFDVIEHFCEKNDIPLNDDEDVDTAQEWINANPTLAYLFQGSWNNSVDQAIERLKTVIDNGGYSPNEFNIIDNIGNTVHTYKLIE